MSILSRESPAHAGTESPGHVLGALILTGWYIDQHFLGRDPFSTPPMPDDAEVVEQIFDGSTRPYAYSPNSSIIPVPPTSLGQATDEDTTGYYLPNYIGLKRRRNLLVPPGIYNTAFVIGMGSGTGTAGPMPIRLQLVSADLTQEVDILSFSDSGDYSPIYPYPFYAIAADINTNVVAPIPAPAGTTYINTFALNSRVAFGRPCWFYPQIYFTQMNTVGADRVQWFTTANPYLPNCPP